MVINVSDAIGNCQQSESYSGDFHLSLNATSQGLNETSLSAKM